MATVPSGTLSLHWRRWYGRNFFGYATSSRSPTSHGALRPQPWTQRRGCFRVVPDTQHQVYSSDFSLLMQATDRVTKGGVIVYHVSV